MTVRNRYSHRCSARLSFWQAALLSCLFLSVRGLVPAGFMPAPLAGGAPYGLCHGDARSALLLSALAQWEQFHHGHRGGHNHDALTAQVFADGHCSFSAGAALAAAPALITRFFTAGAGVPAPLSLVGAARSRAYTLPLSRAPPASPAL